jgi:tRNA pseudouridine13 synthase
MTFDPLAPLPWLTRNLPGIGGRIKVHPEDFEVEELPAYQPSGNGAYLYLWTEKKGLGADYFVRQVARRLGIASGEVGTAGLKDRHAVTRQMVSVPDSCESKLAQLEGEGIRVLNVSRHGNKLKTGHLHGNRFRILIRETDPTAADRLPSLLAQLQKFGLPNFYGAQRFGRQGETLQLGMSLLTGTKCERRPPRNPFLRKLALSAAQSAVFNHYLAARLAAGCFRQVLAGDVMGKWPFGGLFVAENLPVEQARFEARETVHMGPIFGRKTFASTGLAAEREQAALAEAGLSPSSFVGFVKLLMGTRRHNVIYPNYLTAALEPEGVRLHFELPAGSYATVLLGEIMKISISESDESS